MKVSSAAALPRDSHGSIAWLSGCEPRGALRVGQHPGALAPLPRLTSRSARSSLVIWLWLLATSSVSSRSNTSGRRALARSCRQQQNDVRRAPLRGGRPRGTHPSAARQQRRPCCSIAAPCVQVRRTFPTKSPPAREATKPAKMGSAGALALSCACSGTSITSAGAWPAVFSTPARFSVAKEECSSVHLQLGSKGRVTGDRPAPPAAARAVAHSRAGKVLAAAGVASNKEARPCISQHKAGQLERGGMLRLGLRV